MHNLLRLLASVVVIAAGQLLASAVDSANQLLSPSSVCPVRHWFNGRLDACVPCASCTNGDRVVVLRPCQLHQDTVCGTLNDLEFEWNLLQHRHIAAGHENVALASDRTAAAAAAASVSGSASGTVQRTWEWQASSMAFAAIACMLFVSALVYILYQHAKQWRHMENMERRFDRDVEQLSAQLMHNIVDLRSIDPNAGAVNASGGNGSSGPSTGHHRHPHHPQQQQHQQQQQQLLCNAAIIVPGQRQQQQQQQQLLHQPHHHHIARGFDDDPKSSGVGGGTLIHDDHGTIANAAATTPANASAAVESSGNSSSGSGELRRCMYLEQLLVGAPPIRGNVYTEETKTLPASATAASGGTSKKAPLRAAVGQPQQQQQQQQQRRVVPTPPTNASNGISPIGLHRMQTAFGKK